MEDCRMPSDYEAITRYNEDQLGKDTASRKSQVNMYSDFSHFVFEILQNADDYGATSVTFELNPDRLSIEHNGIPFTEENVKAISYFGKGTSRDDLIKTGQFGLGFKSVFSFTATPIVHSGEEDFQIYGLYRLKALTHPADLKSEETRIYLPFNHEEEQPDFVEALVSREKAYNKISHRLKKLDITTLLFTRNLLEIKWSIQGEEGHYLREDKDKKENNNNFRARKTEITDGNSLHTYLVFSRPIKWHEKKYKPVEVAFFLDETNKKVKSIQSTKKPLIVLFPTTQETKMGFLINGPFRTPAHRETVSQDDEFNQFLVKNVAKLICEALPQIREMGLLTVSFLETLPIKIDDFPEDGMLYPIVTAVRDAFVHQELLPADDGTFVSVENAKLASAEWLHTLLQYEQLRQLLKTENSLKWISGEITDQTKRDLWKFMREELHVEEIKPESFARKIDASFLEKQTDDWMSSFYTYLVGQKALWKKRSNYWRDDSGPLRAKQFIRRQDGAHVMPFRDDGSSNIFLANKVGIETTLPIVKLKITLDEEVYNFLKDLGIPDLDLVEEVIEKILPKYKTDSPTVTINEHKLDIIKIERAYATDSQEKKVRLRKQLCLTSFLRADNPLRQKVTYIKPDGTYFDKNDLQTYFAGNENIWFVKQDYDQSALELFKQLGAADSVRVKCTQRNRQGHIPICSQHGWHRRGLYGFDPDIEIEGLKYAITHPTEKRSLFIWINIAAPYAECICGIVETSTRKTYEDSRKESHISEFGQFLRDTAWLPGIDNQFYKPSELTLDDLPDAFIRDEKLADQLGMKKNVVAKLAEEIGIPTEYIEFMKQNPEKIKQLMDNVSAKEQKPSFPERPVSDPDRRGERLSEQINDAPDKEYKHKNRSIRTTAGKIDPIPWLRNHYTNNDGLLICQICKTDKSFKRRDGEFHFEKKEAFSEDFFTKEHEAQYLALCPRCAAMYNHFITKDNDAMVSLKNVLVHSENTEIPLQLGELSTSLRFVETHFHDIKVILKKANGQ